MISKNNAEHYIWGDRCDGWRLINDEQQSIIHERMPPGTKEVRHYHEYARQFFFVLSGTLTMEMNGMEQVINTHEGIEVPCKAVHQVFNKSNEDLEFLVISTPSTKYDRVVLPS
ncbi:cupin domain-containing protein [Paenibacillus turpanensis]|uniref:cupin domain-containing protein n=1 Tax=Paenibacillus turpanensis TaxID=2689078 RepID=UPI00140BBCC9|nr:cupin domain-containing protein [Paenibacillus turpanensis]